MTTLNWDCPNNHIINGVYNKLPTQVNGKDAWQKEDGIYLRWASMWTQWIFDDDTEDNTSVAWKSSTSSSVSPPTGIFSDYRYGNTCGNNEVVVESLSIIQVDCNNGTFNF